MLLYDKTGDERYLQFAKTLAEDSYTQSVKDEKGIHWNGWYDYMGDGGVIAYWIYLAEKTKDGHYLKYAKEALDAILSLKSSLAVIQYILNSLIQAYILQVFRQAVLYLILHMERQE